MYSQLHSISEGLLHLQPEDTLLFRCGMYPLVMGLSVTYILKFFVYDLRSTLESQ